MIAVLGQEVIAYGKSAEEVMHQVAEKVGKRPVLISTIDEIVDPKIVEIPTPRLEEC